MSFVFKFQFLIGDLQTSKTYLVKYISFTFQFLIGDLQTRERDAYKSELENGFNSL